MVDEHDENEFRPKSKQQLKREAEAVQALGAALVALPSAQFKRAIDKLDLPERLLHALEEYRRIKAHEAKRRQLQFIGKLMRDIDPAPVQAVLTEQAQGGRRASAQLHQLEEWRERLLTEGDAALNELLNLHPAADAKRLRQLIQQARQERSQQATPRAARQLFKLLRETMQGHADTE